MSRSASRNNSPRAASATSLIAQISNSPIVREIFTVAIGLGVALCVVTFMGKVFEHSPSRRDVDRTSCDCTCWDAAFKNGYRVAGYRTAYFSFDERLPALSAWLAVALLLSTWLVRHTMMTILSGEARSLMLLSILVQLYSHHYSFWAGFNYLNEGFWGFFSVQVIFCLTEIAATSAAALQLSIKAPLIPRALWVMIGISLFHAYHNLVDWTTSNIGLPIMLAGDIIQAAVAVRFLTIICAASAATATTVTTTTPKMASANDDDDSKCNTTSGKANAIAIGDIKVVTTFSNGSTDYDEWDDTTSTTTDSIENWCRRRAITGRYSYRQLQIDAVVTGLCVVVFSFALKIWQTIAHDLGGGSR
jgi:hypothetical protein